MSSPSNRGSSPRGPYAGPDLSWEAPAARDVPGASAAPADAAPSDQRPRRTGVGLLIGLGLCVAAVVAIVAASCGSGAERPSGAGTCDDGDPGCGAAGSPSQPVPRGLEIPDGSLGVASLGALTPEPDGPWAPMRGPGEDELLIEDAHTVQIVHETRDLSSWISYFGVGRMAEFGLEADPDDLHATGSELVTTWAYSYAFSSATGVDVSEPVTRDTVVDGRRGVLVEATVEWTYLDSSSDSFEDVAMLFVPTDSGTFLGVASIPESGSAYYDDAVAALLATTFQHSNYVP